jgi:hypothetical protein
MSGFNSSNSGWIGDSNPKGVSNPTKKATNTSTAPFVYSRRYLDWNRHTFHYHATDDQPGSYIGCNVDAHALDEAIDSQDSCHVGAGVTGNIAAYRKQYRLGEMSVQPIFSDSRR